MSETNLTPERIDDFTWRLPKGAVSGMRVPGIVFATEDLIRKAMDDRALAEGVGYPLSVGIGVEEDAELTEDGGVLETARPEYVSDRARDRAAEQLGSLGGGNHFLEVQVVREIYDQRAAEAMRLYVGQ